MNRNVLIVDDDTHILELVKHILQHSGFEVRTCRDGYSAIEEVTNKLFDLVILDISMPHVNGFKFLKAIRANPQLKDLPVIMLTSSTDKSDISEAKAHGITDFLIKPPKREELLKRVELALGGRPQYQEIKFTDEPLAAGILQLSTRVKAISVNGFILSSRYQLVKGETLSFSAFELFKTLKLEKCNFTIGECQKQEDGNFEYFISFIDLTKDDLAIIRNWVMNETFSRRK